MDATHRIMMTRLVPLAALAAVVGLLAIACSSPNSARGSDTSAIAVPREYFGSVLPVDGGVLVGGGLYRDTSGSWTAAEEQALYDMSGALIGRSTVVPPAGMDWAFFDSAGHGRLALALSCSVPLGEETGCFAANKPLYVIDLKEQRASQVEDTSSQLVSAIGGSARVLAEDADGLLVARATSERGMNTLEGIELASVTSDGVYSALKRVSQSQLNLLCATTSQIFVGVPKVVGQAATGLEVMVLDRKGTTTDTFNLEVPPLVSSGQFACSDERSYVVMDAFESDYVAELAAGSPLRNVIGSVESEGILASIVDGDGQLTLASRAGNETVVYRTAGSGELVRAGELSKRWPVVLLANGSTVLTVGAGADPLSDRITLEPVPEAPD